MRLFFLRTSDLHLQPWFLTLLVAYSVLELSFNHRLLDLTGNPSANLTASDLHGMEIWARVVSGLGLALLLMRWLAGWFRSKLFLVFFCTAIGLLCMWHAQKALVDFIVAQANQTEMSMSVKSYAMTAEVLNGRMSLRGEPVLTGPVTADLKPALRALWSASVLGLTPDDLDVSSGAAQLVGHWFVPAVSPAQMRDAYRRTVMTPVALGASLFFGLLNICQLLASATGLLMVALRRDRWLERSKAWVLPGWLALCIGLSWWPGNALVESAGYTNVARPALWQQKPFLAPFVDWSLRAEPAWSDPVAWVHRELLADFRFRDPLKPLLE